MYAIASPLVGLPPDVASAGEVRLSQFLGFSSCVDCISHVIPATPHCALALNSVLTKVRAATTARDGARSAFETALQQSANGMLFPTTYRLEFSAPAGAPAVFIGAIEPVMLFAGSPEAVGRGMAYEDISPDAAVAVWTLSADDSTRLLRAIGRLWRRSKSSGEAPVGEAEDDALGSDYEVYREAEMAKLDNAWTMPDYAMVAPIASIRSAYVAARGCAVGGGGRGGGGDGSGSGGGSAGLSPLAGLPPDVTSAGEVRVTQFVNLYGRVACISHVVPASPRYVHALNSVLTKVRTAMTGRDSAGSTFETALQQSSHGERLASMYRLEFSTPPGAPAIFIGSTPPLMLFAGSPEAVGGGKTHDDIEPDAAVVVWTLSAGGESTRLQLAIDRLWRRCQYGAALAEAEADDDALGTDFELYRVDEMAKLIGTESMTYGNMATTMASIRAAYIAAHGGGGGGGGGIGGGGGDGVGGGGDGGGAGGDTAPPAT